MSQFRLYLYKTNTYLASVLGVVTSCTLHGKVKDINVDGRSYCVVDWGNMKHAQAIEFCKKLNARLPLPRSKKEADEFRKVIPFTITSSVIHADARNPKKTANKAEWVDAESKPLGNRPVNLRGHKFSVFLRLTF